MAEIQGSSSAKIPSRTRRGFPPFCQWGLSQVLQQRKGRKEEGKPNKELSKLRKMMGWKEICTLHTAGRWMKTHPALEDKCSDKLTHLLEASAALSLYRQKDLFCWSLAGWLLHRPLKLLGCFCSESIKSRLDGWPWKKKWLVQSEQVSRQSFKHGHRGGCPALASWHGNTCLGWKENYSLWQPTKGTEVTAQHWVSLQFYKCLLFKCN